MRKVEVTAQDIDIGVVDISIAVPLIGRSEEDMKLVLFGLGPELRD